ncbi:hypothetical protein [Alistipes sp.]|uniref:hyaluronate lyase N-terminal domain-containing protein n=1 Tax=Alistipes sp. TaxID=1872444 RepID=UPI003AF0DB19
MANVTLKTKLILRNDTEANWQNANPVLLKGEAGYCSDQHYLKFGDGTTSWTDLPRFNKNNIVLKGIQPDDDTDTDYEIGTIWINTLSDPPEIFLRIRHNQFGDTWVNVLLHNSLISLGVMREVDFAKSPGTGARTGYVDKALTADKLKSARAIALTGGVTGSANFDGSGNLDIATTLNIAENNIPSLPLSKIRDAGTAASRNVGTAAGQVPLLDASGKLNTSVLPQLAIVDVVEAASDAEMIAKTVQKGDICLRSDAPAGAFILAGEDLKVLANWKRIPVPGNAVLSVNGKIGVITLTTDDIAEGSRMYFTNERLTAYLQDTTNTFIMDGGNA